MRQFHPNQFEVLWIFIRNGAIPRSGLKRGTTALIRPFIEEHVFQAYYNKEIGEEALYELIETIESKLEVTHPEKSGLLFGNAQKFVNLCLKGMWMCGWLKKESPHFPVDRVIQKAIVGKTKAWTKMSRSTYECIIGAEKKGRKRVETLPQWELRKYNELKAGLS